jgi:hypothetical protein
MEKNALQQMNAPSHKNPYQNFRTDEQYYLFGQGWKHMKSATLK